MKKLKRKQVYSEPLETAWRWIEELIGPIRQYCRTEAEAIEEIGCRIEASEIGIRPRFNPPRLKQGRLSLKEFARLSEEERNQAVSFSCIFRVPDRPGHYGGYGESALLAMIRAALYRLQAIEV